MDLQPLDDEAGLGDAVARINQNTALLQKVIGDLTRTVQVSADDRVALHKQADATDARLTGTASTLSTVGAQASSATSAVTAAAYAAATAQALAASVSARLPRAANGMAPAITSVVTTASADVTLTWPSPWPDTSYTVLAALEPPASLLGKVSVAVKAKTATTVTLTVTSSAILSAGSVPVRAASFP